jgi:hypothetical protein
MTMAKAKKAWDLSALIACPHDDHKVDLAPGSGFFMIDLADPARKTMDEQSTFADDTKDMNGGIGYADCTYSLADAIENTDVPDKVFCMEGNPSHLARTDSSCEIHPGSTNGLRQVIINLFKLQVEVRKASNRAVREKENLPVIRIPGLLAERSFFPITLYSALELSTLVQGSGEVQGEDVTHLPKYIKLLSKQVFEKTISKPMGLPPASRKDLEQIRCVWTRFGDKDC